MNSSEVRTKFVEYFKSHGHTHVESSSLIPSNDPTLLFTNSGMVQFKNVFVGLDKRPYNRATTHQKSVRAGGKHNDLDNVGHTSRHHTFFEMLGNFSFGDYFKKEAIKFAWDLLTNVYKIPKDKLYVTIHIKDDEAEKIWVEQEGVPKNRISRFDKDNFWQMADTGPCGPCSEIFFDHGEKGQHNCPDKKACKVGCSCDRYVEIWNLVFMQFNRDEKGIDHPLPKPSVDTGSGLERLTAALQGVSSNYDTDLFTDLFKVMEKISGKNYFPGKSDDISTAMRVLADHARASAFLIADGVIPSNEGRGYVLRRIMRRGIRYGKKISEKSLVADAVLAVIKKMAAFYPELKTRETFILETVKTEELNFIATLDKGTELLQSEITELKSKNIKIIPGEVVFKLYDTFGFPVDLTKIMAFEEGFEIDEQGFASSMEKQKQMARASWKGGSKGNPNLEALMKATQGMPATKFVGYESLQANAKVVALFENGQKIDKLASEGVLITDATPFYPEGGGQVGDFGQMVSASLNAEITNTKKINDVYIHFINVTKGELKVGDSVSLKVAPERKSTQRNHSATHLMHAALRKVLGTHVTQAGSLVEPDRLRFDFTHPKPLSPEEIRKIETLVNTEIKAARPVDVKLMGYKEAVGAGAMALFGEKYGDQVRVLKMGDFSTELCGGTHVDNTSDIKLFKLISETGVSSGVRRIEAITGDKALEVLQAAKSELTQIENELNANKGKALDKIISLTEQFKNSEAKLKSAVMESWIISIEKLVSNAKVVKDAKVVSFHLPVNDREVLSALSDKIKDKLGSGVIILIGSSSSESPQSPITVSVTKDLTTKFNAGNILKAVAAIMGGKGGGKPEFAQGAAPQSEKAAEAIKKSFELI